jgi:asparagine synthase (glutamine-hydrolysing)
MCGILAIYKKQGLKKEDIQNSFNSLQRIKHRGPDGEGVVLINSKTGVFKVMYTPETPKDIKCDIFIDEFKDDAYDLLFGHRRLSIIELSSAGHQPMMDELGNWITFNGEIYNYLEIKSELKKLGATFKTQSDTEVILKAYNYWGTKCLSKFNGMWSFVIFNNHKKKLFVSNDRFGVKPLYYFSGDDELLLFSEQKQLASYLITKPNYNTRAFDLFLNFGIVDNNEETFHENILRFKPGHYLDESICKFDSKEAFLNQQKYYDLPQQIDYGISHEDALAQFQYLIKDSVKLRLRSDVPFAFALSGGLDSSIILYIGARLLKENNIDRKLDSYSVIFKGFEGDESYFMEVLEKEMRLNSTYVEPMNSFAMNDFENFMHHQDSPVLTTTYYAAWCIYKKMATTNQKILFVGQGADEVFGGYHHHAYRYFRNLLLSNPIHYFKEVSAYANIKGWEKREIHSYVYNDIKKILKSSVLKKTNPYQEDIFNCSLSKTFKCDLTETMLPNYLKCDDRSSMAFGIETRHPFMDYRLIDFAMKLPTKYKINSGWQKQLLRQAIPEMNAEIAFRKDKKGFTTPQNLWIEKNKREFDSYLSYLPENSNAENSDLFRKYSLGCWLKINALN